MTPTLIQPTQFQILSGVLTTHVAKGYGAAFTSPYCRESHTLQFSSGEPRPYICGRTLNHEGPHVSYTFLAGQAYARAWWPQTRTAVPGWPASLSRDEILRAIAQKPMIRRISSYPTREAPVYRCLWCTAVWKGTLEAHPNDTGCLFWMAKHMPTQDPAPRRLTAVEALELVFSGETADRTLALAPGAATELMRAVEHMVSLRSPADARIAVLEQDYRTTQARAAELKQELHTADAKLAACSAAAVGNTPVAQLAQRLAPGHPYYSAAYADVCNVVDREIMLLEEREVLRRERDALGRKASELSAFRTQLCDEIGLSRYKSTSEIVELISDAMKELKQVKAELAQRDTLRRALFPQRAEELDGLVALVPPLSVPSPVPLTIALLCLASRQRCAHWHPIDSWSPLEWAGAMAGETGEACNTAKKLKRIEKGLANLSTDLDRSVTERQQACRQIGLEVADAILYGVLLTERVGENLESCLREAFNRKSELYGFPEQV